MWSILSQTAFWLSLLGVAYVYIGYPLTLLVLAAVRGPRRVVASGEGEPSVSVLIAAYNESRHIAATVANKLEQDYPRHLIEVIVVSDGSDDGTDEVLAGFHDERVTVLRQGSRQGKTAALNRAVAAARGEVLVFSDANSDYRRDAVTKLVACFADSSVGYVTGQLAYQDPGQTAVGGGSGLYLRYENWLRTLETRVGSIVGVNGGIDAVRKELYRPMRADHLPDLILPLRVTAQGYRVVYCPAAMARETALGFQGDEFRMRVRVSLRALHALWEMRSLLAPGSGFFAIQLLVHKTLRYLVAIAMATALVTSSLLLQRPLYALLFEAQCLFYGLALMGWLSAGRIRLGIVFVPYYFCLLNLAAAVAFARFLRGERQIIWAPRKGA